MKISQEQIAGLNRIDTKNIKGGWRSVQTLEELNAIPAENRAAGMRVYVCDSDTEYQYDAKNDEFKPVESYQPVTDEELDEILNGEEETADPLLSSLFATKTVRLDEEDVAQRVLRSAGILLREAKYSVGSRVFAVESGSINIEWVLECAESGTTGVVDVILNDSMKAGQIIQDGTVKWILKPLRSHLENYYTKEEVDSRISTACADVYARRYGLDEGKYYSKDEIDSQLVDMKSEMLTIKATIDTLQEKLKQQGGV